MGLLRAMHKAGALEQVTTVGGNSGGQWLLTQLLYSESFYKSIASDDDLVEVIANWGEMYHEKIANLLPASSNSTVNFRELGWRDDRRREAEERANKRREARENAMRHAREARERAEQRARDAADAAARAVAKLAQEAADKIQDAKDAAAAAKASAEAAVEAAKAKAQEALEWAQEKRAVLVDAADRLESFLVDVASGDNTVCPSGGSLLESGLDVVLGFDHLPLERGSVKEAIGLPVTAARHHALAAHGMPLALR